MNDVSMRICVLSNTEELSPPSDGCQHVFTVLRSKTTQAVPEADLYIWDYSPGLELRPEIWHGPPPSISCYVNRDTWTSCRIC